MTVLAPMRPEAFGAYVEASLAAYAEDNVAAGRWPREGALERARADQDSLLPQGLATPGHHVFEILDAEGGMPVGVIWMGIDTSHGLRSGFVYDVLIHPEWRRRGHAMRAFQALEPLAAELGLDSIGLHVFGHNPGAQALYARLGYGVTGINMVKRLDAGDASGATAANASEPSAAPQPAIQRGSCLCRRVTYQISGPLEDVLNCHCSMCRKLHAAAFRTRARVATKDWRTLSGEASIKFYESSPGEYKAFCSECGSSLFTRFDRWPDQLGFPLGTLDTDPGVKPGRHLHVGSKAPWFDITDSLPRREAG